MPIAVTVYCGEWVDGSTLENPTAGHGIYYYNTYNQDSQQYETHEVRHNGGRWRCLQNQPVVSNGVTTYYEPTWKNRDYWELVDGNENYSIEFVSSRGYSFRRGYVNTHITPYLFYGNVDISEDVDAEYWSWTRCTEETQDEPDPYTVQDKAWNAQHEQTREIDLTNQDMPSTWSSANKAIFTCTVVLNDGKTTRTVQNQIIS